MRLEGTIIGFDEFMNVTLDDASEVYVKSGKEARFLGRFFSRSHTGSFCLVLVGLRAILFE